MAEDKKPVEDKIYGAYVAREGWTDDGDESLLVEVRSRMRILVEAPDDSTAESLIKAAYREREDFFTQDRPSKKYPQDTLYIRYMESGKALARATGFSMEELEDLVNGD